MRPGLDETGVRLCEAAAPKDAGMYSRCSTDRNHGDCGAFAWRDGTHQHAGVDRIDPLVREYAREDIADIP
jgi:hypothetical protein